MNNTISTSKLKNITGVEIMSSCLFWCITWSSKDFSLAFKDSPLGHTILWNKFKSLKEQEKHNATSAAVNFVVELNQEHKQMLFNYLFENKDVEMILNNRALEDQLTRSANENTIEGIIGEK